MSGGISPTYSSTSSSPGRMKRMPMRSPHAFSTNSDATLPLVFANVGLILFVVAGVFYIKEDWDRFSLLCVLGYASIIIGLILPELLAADVDKGGRTTFHPTGTREIDDKIDDKLMTLQSLTDEGLDDEASVTIWHPQMRVFLWTEICLILFAIAGVVVVSLPNALGEAFGLFLFALGALIKVCLLFYELRG